MSLLSYLFICEWGFTMFYIVFRIRNVTFIYFFKERCNFLCFFIAVCKNGPFGFLLLWISVLVVFVLVEVSRI
jgi:hypothetical protein